MCPHAACRLHVSQRPAPCCASAHHPPPGHALVPAPRLGPGQRFVDEPSPRRHGRILFSLAPAEISFQTAVPPHSHLISPPMPTKFPLPCLIPIPCGNINPSNPPNLPLSSCQPPSLPTRHLLLPPRRARPPRLPMRPSVTDAFFILPAARLPSTAVFTLCCNNKHASWHGEHAAHRRREGKPAGCGRGCSGGGITPAQALEGGWVVARRLPPEELPLQQLLVPLPRLSCAHRTVRHAAARWGRWGGTAGWVGTARTLHMRVPRSQASARATACA